MMMIITKNGNAPIQDYTFICKGTLACPIKERELLYVAVITINKQDVLRFLLVIRPCCGWLVCQHFGKLGYLHLPPQASQQRIPRGSVYNGGWASHQ
jgi:hypothetical protein